jgi:hypothetical protein
MLARARLDLPFLAALHPTNAVAIFGLGVTVARRATALALQTALSATTSTELLEGAASRP